MTIPGIRPVVRGTVRDIEPPLVDAPVLIYQFSDRPGCILDVSDGGLCDIAFEADVPDLYAGATSPGMYRTDSARGLIQLGSVPVGRVSVDAKDCC